MNSKDLVSLIVLYYPESKSLITIYTKAFSTAQAENYTVSCSHIPTLLHFQEVESALELIKKKLAVFTSVYMKDAAQVQALSLESYVCTVQIPKLVQKQFSMEIQLG